VPCGLRGFRDQAEDGQAPQPDFAGRDWHRLGPPDSVQPFCTASRRPDKRAAQAAAQGVRPTGPQALGSTRPRLGAGRADPARRRAPPPARPDTGRSGRVKITEFGTGPGAADRFPTCTGTPRGASRRAIAGRQVPARQPTRLRGPAPTQVRNRPALFDNAVLYERRRRRRSSWRS
jgi:hypothetical protein